MEYDEGMFIAVAAIIILIIVARLSVSPVGVFARQIHYARVAEKRQRRHSL